MNSRAVQVRLSLEGGKQVESELVMIGQRGQAAMGQLDRGMQGVARTSANSRAAIQNTAFQLGDMAVQMAAGTSASRAMAMQLPQLLGGFGVMGAVVGAAFAVLAPFVMKMFEAGEATNAFVKETMDAHSASGAVQASMSGLRDLAVEYNKAIRDSGSASSSAAGVVLANSEAEFKARKRVLEIELSIMRARHAEERATIESLQSQINVGFGGLQTDLGVAAQLEQNARYGSGGITAIPEGLARATAGFGSVRTASEVTAWLEANKRDLEALQLANADWLVDDLQLQKYDAIMNSEFATLATAAEIAGAGKSKGGGGSKKPEKVVKEGVDAMVETLMEFQKKAQDIGAEVGAAITAGFSAAEDAVANFVKTGKFEIGDLVTDMLAQFARLATQHFITGPLAGLVGSALGNIGGGFGAAMQGALTSFDGGGWTGNGARSGGLDGRGGFLAMLHPREHVYDTTKGQRPGGGIVMNVYARDAQSFARSRTQVASDMARMLASARRGM